MGAFDYGIYKKGMDGRDDSRLGAAIIAIKKELIANGFDKGIDLTVEAFGDAMKNRVVEFQASRLPALTADGQVGSKTLVELFRARVVSVEKKYGIPSGALGKKLKLESGYDPVAIGYVDPKDTGIAQINLGAHPDVSKEEAFDPVFAIDWAGRYIKSNFDSIASRANVIKAARAAYNIGNNYAYQWMMAGFPEEGGPLLNGQDVYARATRYIELIDKQVW